MNEALARILGGPSTPASPATTTLAPPSSLLLTTTKPANAKEEAERLEKKALRIFKQEQRQRLRSIRVAPPAVNNHEKEVRKLATLGVVRLFNAVHQAQLKKEACNPCSKTSKKPKLTDEPAKPTVDFSQLLKGKTPRE